MRSETRNKMSSLMSMPDSSPELKLKSKSREDFVLKLIEEVKKRPQLWDKNLPNYSIYKANKNFWEEIAKKLNVKVRDAKEKWANLRECYRSQVLKLRSLEMLGKGHEFKPTWRHYHRMDFLKPFISHKQCTLDESTKQFKTNKNASIRRDSLSISRPADLADKENLSYATDFVENIQNSSQLRNGSSSFKKGNHSEVEECDSDESNAPSNPNSSTGHNTTYKSCLSDDDVQLCETANNKNILTENRFNIASKTDKNSTKYENEDYYFAMSLLPSLAELSRERKIVARHRINQVLFEEYSLSKK